jgi:hypothetical protein
MGQTMRSVLISALMYTVVLFAAVCLFYLIIA